jgi:hypothetical protein
MQKFWDTVREQMEAHHGGSKWVGTKGNSPFGHSGQSERGVRVQGTSQNRSALKVIGERRYVEYSDETRVREENLRQALESLKHMKNEGPRDRLNLDATIYETARNGGEIDLVFERDLRDKISLILLIDNGGYSMAPFVEITRMLFGKLHERFEDLQTYYFHNTIYDRVWTDFRRLRAHPTEQILLRRPDTRIVIVGDATMAPEELLSRSGAISGLNSRNQQPSIYWLNRIAIASRTPAGSTRSGRISGTPPTARTPSTGSATSSAWKTSPSAASSGWSSSWREVATRRRNQCSATAYNVSGYSASYAPGFGLKWLRFSSTSLNSSAVGIGSLPSSMAGHSAAYFAFSSM